MEFNLSTVSFISQKNFMPVDVSGVYDVIIIGGGPAGLTAAVYCMRKGVSTALIVKRIGGQVAETSSIENYMGYRYIGGTELVDKFREQVQQFGIAYDEGHAVSSVEPGDIKRVRLDDGRCLSSKSLIIASGKSWRKLGVPGESEFTGKGVAYCTICDAPFFAGKQVVVVGGGNTAVGSAIDLARVASRVTLVHRRDTFRADKILEDKLSAFRNVDYIYSSIVTAVKGDSSVRAVIIKNLADNSEYEFATDGVFVETGLDPDSGFVKGCLDLNSVGEIVVDSSCATTSEGIFAAGDVTSVKYKQIIIAAGEGAKAALSACDYLMARE